MMNGDIMQAKNNQKLRDWPGKLRDWPENCAIDGKKCAIDGNSIEEKS